MSTLKLQYTSSKLNRADAVRRSNEQVQALWDDPASKLVPLCNTKNFFNSDFEPVITDKATLGADPRLTTNKTFLGLADGIAYFSVQCSDADVARLEDHYPGTEFHDLRTAGAGLSNDIASILAYARGLSHWQNTHKFCGRCGGKQQLQSAGHVMQCEACQSLTFPRTDPAVIMLVEHVDGNGDKKCLLGRSPAWPEGCYSTLAGFVETGETLEAAVIREVFEEAGIRVINPRYVSSQPWPFPQSIMLGFIATAENTELLVDHDELVSAKWCSADELAQFGEWADESDGDKLPRVDSIARFLIDSWIAEQRNL